VYDGDDAASDLKGLRCGSGGRRMRMGFNAIIALCDDRVDVRCRREDEIVAALDRVASYRTLGGCP